MRFTLPLLLSLSFRRRASAFVPASGSSVLSRGTGRNFDGSPSWRSRGLAALPTVADVSADDFMKQLGHASQIIPLLHPAESDGVLPDEEYASMLQILSSQFGHSDGVRGFFAVYLTSPESQEAEEVPPVLAEAVRGADAKVMVPLACMNVIMPTAMSSIHQDAELKECAAKTASNGIKILRLLKGDEDVTSNCRAIRNVCSGDEAEDEEGSSRDLMEYWEKFFVNYKYEEPQKNDIALAVSEFC